MYIWHLLLLLKFIIFSKTKSLVLCLSIGGVSNNEVLLTILGANFNVTWRDAPATEVMAPCQSTYLVYFYFYF